MIFFSAVGAVLTGSTLEYFILVLMGLACAVVGAVLFTIGTWGVGAIVLVAMLARKEEAVIHFVKPNKSNKRKSERKEHAFRCTFLARTFLTPML